ncbi:MAG TPA: glycosyltransferase family 4 protein [Thermoanaerobaculia bacterium]|nr:glycosyltransferase family 4 protein [Thermoanaerobaculia bacterium]
MPLKILMMADTPADPNRGAAGTEVQTARALQAIGHEVDTFWAEDLGRRIRHGNLHLLLELPYTYERAAVAALRRKTYNVVHANQPHGYRAARAVHRISPQTAFIHRSHGFELNVEATLRPWRKAFGSDERGAIRRIASGAIAPLLSRHAHAIARDADGHIVSSSLDSAFLQECLGVAAERIAVIPQAVPDSFAGDEPPSMDSARLHRVLHVGQFAFVKAPMITAAAINRLAEADRRLQFTWVCDPNSETAVRALLTAGANERLDVLPWTTQDALRDVYDAHGIFLFPSFFEGFGKAFLEAMSRGLCVMASDVGGMHDIIENGRNGVLVSPGDANALADAALTFTRDPDRAGAMSLAATTTARRHTWDRVARETADFYRVRLSALDAMRR